MIRPRLHLALAAAFAAATIAWLGAALAADGPTPETDAKPLRFRRALVPVDHLEQVLSHPALKNYVSIKPREFQRLTNKTGPARIVEATYQARLVDETLLVGTAQLEVECPDGQQAGLLLEGCKLPIDNPRWHVQADQAEDKKQDAQEALVGLDARGRLVAWVDRSARLTFSWSLRGTKDAAGVVRFPLQLPASPSSHFQIDLPRGKTLQTTEGVVELEADSAKRLRPDDELQRRVWTIRLGSRNRLSLLVAPEGLMRQGRQLTLVRQHSIYQISTRGVVLTTTLNLDVHHESLRRVSLLLDPLIEQETRKQGVKSRFAAAARPLQLVRARYGDSDVRWSVEARPSGAARVELELPEPIQGADRVLTLQATAPLPNRLGRYWRLPRIRSENMFWQEGTAEVALSAPLSLEGVAPMGGRQTPSQSEDSIAVEFFSPDASLDVLVGRRRAAVEVRSGSAIELGPAGVVCRWTAQLQCQRGSHFQLTADVPPQWVVDSVGPPEVIRRWQRNRTAGKLELELRRAITPQRPLQIVIRGHRASPGEVWGIDELRFVTLDSAATRRRLMAIEAAPSYELKLTGAEQLARLDPQSLGEDASLFDPPPRRLLFEVDEGAERLGASWAGQNPTFDASVTVDATLQGGSLRERHKPLAWAWSSYHQSRWSPQGDVAHLVTFHIQNAGREQITLTLPEASTGHAVWINRGQRTPAIAGRHLTLELPSGQKFPTVTLHYTTKGPKLSVWRQITADRVASHLVELDIPQLHRQWKVWLPPGYELFSNTSQRLDDTSREVTWTQRLFGPLGRAMHRETFDPLDAEAWALLVSQPPEQAAARLRANQLLRALASPPAGDQSWGGLLTIAESAAESAAESLPSASHLPLWIDWGALSKLKLSPMSRVSGRTLAETSIIFGDDSAVTSYSGGVPADADEAFRQQDVGMRTLDAANLVLLVHPKAIVLTTRAVAAKYRQAMVALEGESVYWVPPGRLRSRLQHAAPSADSAPRNSAVSLVDVTTWKNIPTIAALPWDSVEELEGPSADHLGWTAYDFGLSGGSPPPLRIVHRMSMQTLGLATTILVIIAWWWLGRVLERKGPVLSGLGDRVRPWLARLRSWPPIARWSVGRLGGAGGRWSTISGVTLPAMTLGLTGAIAMLAPAGVTPITSGLFLGTLAAVLLGPLARHLRLPIVARATAQADDASVSIVKPIGVAVWVTVVLVVGALVGTAMAQQPAGPADHRAPPVPVARVFVPVDAQQRTAGDIWLPRGLYDALRRREARQTDQPRGWLLRSARYRGSLRWQSGQPAQLEGLRVEFDLWTFTGDTDVKLTISRDLVGEGTGSATLDDEPLRLRWDTEGQVATFAVHRAGQHQLRLSLRPRVQHDAAAGVSQLDVAIPTLASSVLELDTPRQVSSIEAPTALGEVGFDRDKKLFTAVLGSADRLKIRWSSRSLREPTAPQFKVDQWLWLNVRPNSVMVEAKIHVEVTKGRLRTLEIDADDRLRLLPPWPVKNVTIQRGQRPSIRLVLDQPVHDELDLHLKFLLTGTSGVGELRQPTFEILGAQTQRRWMAVSVDPSLDFDPGTVARAIRSITPDEFLGMWGDEETSPRLAYQLPQGQAPWSLKTSSRAPRTSAEETLIVSLRRRTARLRFSALLRTSGGAQYQYRLRVPRNMTIDRLRVLQDGAPRLARWTDDDRGNLTVFLIGPVDGPQQLTIEGHLTTPNQGKWQVPEIHMQRSGAAAGVQVASRRIGIYRRPGVLVQVQRAIGLIELKDDPISPHPPSIPQEDPGRLVAWYEKKEMAGRENMQLALAPNQPKVIASQMTTLDQQGEKWTARIDYHIERIDPDTGVVDVLRFGVPEHWDGKIEVSRPAEISLNKIPGENRQQLVVRPAKSIKGPFRLTITGLTLADEPRVELPDIAALGLGETRRFVTLPETVSGQQFQWERRYLDEMPAAALPAYFQLPQQPDRTLKVYEVVKGERPQAIRSSVQQVFDEPLIRLVDLTIAWQTDAVCQGTALFDLEPAGKTDVLLEMPPGYSLVSARVSGIEAGARRASNSDTQWHLALASAQWPQRIEVTFTGQIELDGALEPRFEAPRLVGIDVERTLWTVYAPPSVGVGRPAGEEQQSTALAHAESRLRSLAKLIKEETPLVARSAPEQLVAAWYRPWAERLIAARQEVSRRALMTRVAGSDRIGNVAESLHGGDFDLPQAKISSILQNILSELAGQPPVARTPQQLWQRDLESGPSPTRCERNGPAGELSLQYTPARRSDLAGRIVVALLLLASSAVMVWVVWRGVRLPSPIRWAHAVAVAVGIAWWLWLSPSLLGGLIVMVAVLLTVWPTQRRRRPHAWSLWPARRAL